MNCENNLEQKRLLSYVTANIISIGKAVPSFQIKQDHVFEFMAAAHGLEGRDKDRLKALYRVSGITCRHSVVPDYGTLDKTQWQLYPHNDELSPFPTTKDRNELYRKSAMPLASAAIEDCISEADKNDITHLITVSCTGLYAPGLDIDLVNHLQLSPDVQRTCINYMGCYAAITALRNANAICKANEHAKVLIVCVELCTLHFQKENDENNLIANAIFSDGAAAVLISTEKPEHPHLKMNNFLSRIYPNGHEEMAWNIGNNGFEMKLTTYVPDLIESGIEKLMEDLGAVETDFYAVHPGGKRILDVVEKSLAIEKTTNRYAHHVLKNYGNMSSPTILFVLKEILSELREEDRGKSVGAMAFGPGLTIESALLSVG